MDVAVPMDVAVRIDAAVRTVASTGQAWAIVIVAVLVTAFLTAATAVAYRWQNRYHRRLRASGMWDAATAAVLGPGPTVDAPGIVSTAAGRMGPEGAEIADTLPARAAVAPMEETAAGSAYVPAQRTGRRAAPAPAATDEELAAQAEAPTRADLPAQSQPAAPAQRGAPDSEQAQSTLSRPGSADTDDPGRE